MKKSETTEEKVIQSEQSADHQSPAHSPKEVGGRTKGLEPTRYGDWEKGGKCVDF